VRFDKVVAKTIRVHFFASQCSTETTNNVILGCLQLLVQWTEWYVPGVNSVHGKQENNARAQHS